MVTRIAALLIFSLATALHLGAQVRVTTTDLLYIKQRMQIGTDTSLNFTSIVDTITPASTHHQAPSALAVYEAIGEYGGGGGAGSGHVILEGNTPRAQKDSLEFQSNASIIFGATNTSTRTVVDATLESNSVGSAEIAADAVGSSELASTAVTPGSYTAADITVDADGRITAAANGTVDASATNEGSLTVGAGSGSTSVISSNTSGSTDVTLTAGTGIGIAEAGNTITLTNTGDTNAADDITGTLAAGQVPYATGAQTVTGSNNLWYNGPTLTLNSTADDTLLVLTRNNLNPFGIYQFTDPYNGSTVAYRIGGLNGRRIFLEGFGLYPEAPFYQEETAGIGFAGTTGTLRLHTNGDYYTATLTGDNATTNRNVTYYFESGGATTGVGNPVVFQNIFSSNDSTANGFEFISRNTASGGVTIADSTLFRITSWDKGIGFNLTQAGDLGLKLRQPLYSLDINDTDGIRIPRGTTAQRPAGTPAGVVRFNTDSTAVEVGTGSAWTTLGSGSGGGGDDWGSQAVVTDGTLTGDGTPGDPLSVAVDHGVINAMDYGVVGDGVADDLDSLQAAIDAAVGKRLWIPAGRYYISAEVTVASNTEIIMSPDATIDISSWAASGTLGDSRAFNISGSTGTTTTVTADIALGSYDITVSSTTGFTDGDMVEITSTEPLLPGYTNRYKGWVTIVDSVLSSTVIRIANASPFLIDAVGGSYTATLKRFNTVNNVTIRGGKIVGGGLNKGHTGIYTAVFQNINIEGVVIDSCEAAGVWLGTGIQGSVKKCRILNVTSPEYLATLGYGVLIGSGFGAVIENNYFERCRHSVAAGATPTPFNAIIKDNYSYNCGIGTNDYDCHAATIGFVFENNTTHAGPNGRGGFVIRSVDAVLKGNHVYGGSIGITNADGITATTFPLGRITLSDNVIKDNPSGYGIEISGGGISSISISGGSIERCSLGINATGTSENLKIGGVSFLDMTSHAIQLDDCVGVAVSNCTFDGTTICLSTLSSCSDIVMSNCVGKNVTNSLISTYITDNVSVSNCIVSGVTGSSAIYFNRSNNCRVSNCNITMNTVSYDGIRAWGSSATAHNISVIGTKVTGSYGRGLYCFSNSDSITAIGNDFRQATTEQIGTPDATITSIFGNMSGDIGVSMGAAYQLATTANVSNTNTVADRLVIKTNSTGTAAASFGGAILFQGESSTTNNRDMARIQPYWSTATDASRASTIGFQMVTSAGALTEYMRFSPGFSGSILVGSSNAATLSNAGITTATGYTVGNSSSALTLGGSSGSITASTSSSSGIAINSTGTSTGITITTASTQTNTALAKKSVRIGESYAPTASGTGTLKSFSIDNTINQTGGHTGNTWGIEIAPTLTAVGGTYYAVDIAANHSSAKGIYQSGASTTNNFAGATAFGTTSAPNAVAAVEISSTTKGFLLPRMTTTQRDAITAVAGLVIFNTTTTKMECYDGSTWQAAW